MTDDGLYLGSELEGSGRVLLDADHLTTHAVCLGMTGSGKTGLGIVALEELARRRVPLLVVDIKGDMINLLLNFPSFEASDFERWLPADEATDGDPAATAARQAELWRTGLQRSGLGGSDLEAVRDGVHWQLLTPGVSRGAPLDILPALSAPAGWQPDEDPDGATERVNGVTSALLSLVGRGGDPLTDRDHVLVASVILEHWRRGDALDLPRLLASLADPPIDSLGALPLASFYDRDDRMELVMELNTLLASPAFAAWTTGMPLDMEKLLGSPGAPRASIISVAHLDSRQRLFILALLVSELVAWMRRQPASAGLRALLYVDEVQGFLPPHPANPPTKRPLLTLLKQGRAFGVGAWLATQNPVDLDYKALGNAGIKLIGRLITDRDRERALEGLGVQELADGRDPDRVVAGLGKREFLLIDVRATRRVRGFSSRWAMSYLRGPVTLVEMRPLLEGTPETPMEEAAASVASRGEQQSRVPPVLAAAVKQVFAAGAVGLARPELQVRCRYSLTRVSLGLERNEEEVWRVPPAAAAGFDWEAAELLEGELDLVEEAPVGMRFPRAAPPGLGENLGRAEADFLGWRARRPVTVLANRKLKLAAAAGETSSDFLERCLEAADRADDSTQERVRKRFESRMKTLKKRLEREQDELERDREQLGSRKTEEVLGAVEGLFSVLLGSRGVRSASTKAASKVRTAAGKRRMRQRAAASVEESEREIDRIERELEDLAEELQDEIDRIAVESEEKAEKVEEVALRPKRSDVTVLDLKLVWG